MRPTLNVVLSAALALPSVALAQSPARPTLEHVPPGSFPSRAPMRLVFSPTHAERIARIDVLWRARRDGPFVTTMATRTAEGWTVEIPAQEPSVRVVEYLARVETTDGATLDSFATRAAPHAVVMRPDDETAQEMSELARHRGQRLEFALSGEYTSFGARPNPNGATCGMAAGDRCPDYWYSLAGSVRYRFLRVVRSVTVRVERLNGVTTRPNAMGVQASREVGLVAASTEVEFRLAPWVAAAVSATLGANEVSVQGGGGARLEFGSDRPARVILSVNGITDFGVAASAWMRWDTVPMTPMGAGVEATSQPGTRDVGVRLLFEVGRHLGRHVTVLARGGYGARREDASGFTAGLTLLLAL